jgi:ubiquinone/menaquinone biosynthesis C-methylase UbiE
MDVVPQNWYKTWFGNEYLTVYAHRDEHEARKLINLLQSNIQLAADAVIIDLCCGQGRHATHLANLGFRVIGVDLSRTLLEAAKYHGKGSDSAKFVQADMRQLPFQKNFDLLLNLFTSFGYFETDQQNLTVFSEFERVLKKNAWFVFDYMNTDYVKDTLNPCQEEVIENIVIKQNRTIEEDRIQKKITLIDDTHETVFYESVKMYTPQKIYAMLETAGLKIRQVFGDYSGSSFEKKSPRLIIFGQPKG